MRGLRTAVTFLTRIPVGGSDRPQDDVAAGVPWFPVVGAGVGAIVALGYAAARIIFPELLAAGIGVGLGMLVTGALHEDGLADVSDALGGGRDPAERLRILKDPALGTYGTTAIVFSILLRTVAIATFDEAAAFAAIPAAHALSRGATVALIAFTPPAGIGLGASFAASMTRARSVTGIAVGILVGGAFLGAWIVPGAVIGATAALLAGLLAIARFGGVTGDLLGAAQQVAEISILLLCTAVVHNGWRGFGWWM